MYDGYERHISSKTNFAPDLPTTNQKCSARIENNHAISTTHTLTDTRPNLYYNSLDRIYPRFNVIPPDTGTTHDAGIVVTGIHNAIGGQEDHGQ